MASLKHIARTLRIKNAKSHAVFLAVILAVAFGAAVGTRYYAFEPLKLNDSSMHPNIKSGETFWMCKHPKCKENLGTGDYVWAKLPGNESFVRKIIATPGSKISISSEGHVESEGLDFLWKNENAFIESRTIYVPKKGDTLQLNALNDVEEDYAFALLRNQGTKFIVKVSLWQGEKEIGLDRVGATRLENRQVSLQEVASLAWQDRYLIELQIRQNEPGNAPFKLKRKILNVTDSSEITNVVVNEDCYYLACEKGASCLDSRELGYIRKSQIQGRYAETATNVTRSVKSYGRTILVDIVWKSVQPVVQAAKSTLEESLDFYLKLKERAQAD